MYDIIGDVHGHASLLKKLLQQMGYQKINGVYRHPERKAIFVGDFINRGPEIRKTVKIIRGMVENEQALAVLGNHEINAIIYYVKDKQGRLLGNKPSKYFLSLFKTINEFTANAEEWKSHLKWMRTLPLFLDLGEIRVVHACWNEAAIEYASHIHAEGKIPKKIFKSMHKDKESEASKYLWMLCKGINLKMPSDLRVVNNRGVAPRSFRLKWWEQFSGKTFQELSFESKYQLPNYTIPPEILPADFPYPEYAPIVFFGHYCRGKGPHIISPNLCCVDSCVTGTGRLTAYRWQGEKALKPENLISIEN